MKALIIGSVIAITSGVGIYLVGGWTVLTLSILIPLFLLAPLITIGVSLVIGALDGIGDFVGGVADKANEFFKEDPVTVNSAGQKVN